MMFIAILFFPSTFEDDAQSKYVPRSKRWKKLEHIKNWIDKGMKYYGNRIQESVQFEESRRKKKCTKGMYARRDKTRHKTTKLLAIAAVVMPMTGGCLPHDNLTSFDTDSGPIGIDN